MSVPSNPAAIETMQALAAALATPEHPPQDPPKPRPRIIPSVGVHVGVPEDIYHNVWDAASNSALTILHEKSPAHLMAKRTAEPRPETDALRIGRAMHVAILEPDSFESRFVVAGQCEAIKKDKARCTNQGLALSAASGWLCGVHVKGETLAPATGAIILSQSDYRICLNTRDAVHRHARAHGLLTTQSQRELSIVWDDPDTGLRCKARIDCYSPLIAGGAVVDPKSTLDASPEGFARAIYTHGYHRQGAFYLEGCQEVRIAAKHFANIAIEKEEPYAVAVYRLREDAILAGANQLKALKALYARCLDRGEWPGYASDVVDIALPEWAAKKIDADTREEIP